MGPAVAGQRQNEDPKPECCVGVEVGEDTDRAHLLRTRGPIHARVRAPVGAVEVPLRSIRRDRPDRSPSSAEPVADAIQGDVEDRGHVQREQLRKQQASHHRQTEGLT